MDSPLSSQEFDKLVDAALAELPDELVGRIENLHIVVEDLPEDGDEDLLGLYEGVPLTERGNDYYMYLPDLITLYKTNIEAEAETPEEIKEVVRVTVLHEIAHHFGIDDDRLEELGWA